MAVFSRQTITWGRETRREEETFLCGTDRRGTEIGGGQCAGCGADPARENHGAGAVSVEEAVQGLETRQVRQFKQLQEGNERLKRLVTELTLDKVTPQDVLARSL
jgi:hypothetical protein